MVFLVGMVENILPSKKGNLEEERRICFVAISRAMKLLYLSHSLTYLEPAAKRSIFLDEILGNKQPESTRNTFPNRPTSPTAGVRSKSIP